MRVRTFPRTGFTLVEFMIVVAIVAIFALVIGGAIVLWGWGKASVDVVGANRAYDAVGAAGYHNPELVETFNVNADVHCKATDDEVGYHMVATPADGEGRVDLVVCCPSTLSSRPCRVDVR